MAKGVTSTGEEISKCKMVHSNSEVEEMRMVDFRERNGHKRIIFAKITPEPTGHVSSTV